MAVKTHLTKGDLTILLWLVRDFQMGDGKMRDGGFVHPSLYDRVRKKLEERTTEVA